MKQVRNDPAQWTIIGTSPQTTVCHKPSTVSGGGKSEIRSRSPMRSPWATPMSRTSTPTWMPSRRSSSATGQIVTSTPRGTVRTTAPSWAATGAWAVSQLLTPSAEFSDDHNAFIRSIPPHVPSSSSSSSAPTDPSGSGLAQPLLGEPRQRPSRQPAAARWSAGARRHAARRLRVRRLYRLFSLRPDYAAAVKVQTEDDITALDRRAQCRPR